MNQDDNYELRIWCEAQDARKQGDFAKAAELYKECAHLGPNSVKCKLTGQCYLMLKDYNNAILYLAASIGLGPRNTSAMFIFAEALIHADRSYEAAKILHKLLKIEPTNKKARSMLRKLCSEDDYIKTIVEEE